MNFPNKFIVFFLKKTMLHLLYHPVPLPVHLPRVHGGAPLAVGGLVLHELEFRHLLDWISHKKRFKTPNYPNLA